MDSKVCAHSFFIFAKSDANGLFEYTINDETANKCIAATNNCPDELRYETNTAKTTEHFEAENTGRYAAPCAGKAMQRPNACVQQGAKTRKGGL